jgi:hypothetical protein
MADAIASRELMRTAPRKGDQPSAAVALGETKPSLSGGTAPTVLQTAEHKTRAGISRGIGRGADQRRQTRHDQAAMLWSNRWRLRPTNDPVYKKHGPALGLIEGMRRVPCRATNQRGALG